MKKHILTIVILFSYNVGIFAQAYYMHEAAEDYESLSFHEIFVGTVFFGLIYLIHKVYKFFKDLQEEKEERERKYKLCRKIALEKIRETSNISTRFIHNEDYKKGFIQYMYDRMYGKIDNNLINEGLEKSYLDLDKYKYAPKYISLPKDILYKIGYLEHHRLYTNKKTVQY